jgi:integrase
MHSAASVMLSNGIPMIAVRDVLGHSSIETTVDLYGHLTESEKTRATDLLGTAF